MTFAITLSHWDIFICERRITTIFLIGFSSSSFLQILVTVILFLLNLGWYCLKLSKKFRQFIFFNFRSRSESVPKPSEKIGKSLSKIKHGVLGKSIEGIVDNAVMDSAFDLADMYVSYPVNYWEMSLGLWESKLSGLLWRNETSDSRKVRLFKLDILSGAKNVKLNYSAFYTE